MRGRVMVQDGVDGSDGGLLYWTRLGVRRIGRNSLALASFIAATLGVLGASGKVSTGQTTAQEQSPD